jgi:transposase
MEHLAIDLGGRESQVCVRRADATIVEEVLRPNESLGRYLKTRPPSRVILETCAEAFAVADLALAAGHEVRVVPSVLVKALGVGARGVKNDRADARALSLASTRQDLPSVHVASSMARYLRSLCTSRETLIEARTQLINSVRGWMRTELVRVRRGATETFTRRVREQGERAERGLPSFIEPMLSAIDALSAQLERLNDQLEGYAKKDALCKRLMTAPVGPVSAVRVVAAVDTVERFDGAHAVEAYVGLTSGEHRSSGRGYRTGITKAGPPGVRRALVQACWVAMRTRPKDPLVLWATKIKERRGGRVAVVAMARKLVGILYAMWRDGSVYDPCYEEKRRRRQEATPSE